jgi:hypothetical protein
MYENIQDAPVLMNGLRKYATYMQWDFIHPQRRRNFVICRWNYRTTSE